MVVALSNSQYKDNIREAKEMNAVEMLVDDHNQLKKLFGKVRETESEKEKRNLFEQIKTVLDAHTHIEEEVFYPAVREKEEIEDIVMEGLQEHHQADLFIREIENLAGGSDVFVPKLQVLMEGVEHHIDEEEKEMFPKVRDQFSGSELDEMASRMQKAKSAAN